MPQAIFDPQEARQCAAQLDRLAEDTMQQALHLFAQFSDLESHWRDRKYARFAKSLNEAMVAVRRYHDSVRQEADFLRRKAAAAQTYLDS